MPDEIDWRLTTYEGNRRRQHEELRALSFREKLIAIEQSGEVAEYFLSRRAARGIARRAEKLRGANPAGHRDIRRQGRDRQGLNRSAAASTRL